MGMTRRLKGLRRRERMERAHLTRSSHGAATAIRESHWMEALEPRVLLAASAVTDGLVAHYPGDIVGGVAVDVWGGYDGAPENGATALPGLNGNAFYLPDLGGATTEEPFIQLPESFDSDNMTFAAWVYHTDSEPISSTIFANRHPGCAATELQDGTSLYINQFATASRTMVVEYNDGSVGCQTFQPLPGDLDSKVWLRTWTFVAMTVEDGRARLYIDGELAEDSGADLGRTLSTKPARLGSHLSDPGVSALGFTGLIDEVTIHNRALSPAELMQLAAPEEVAPGTVILEDHFDGTEIDRTVWRVNEAPMARSYLNGVPIVSDGTVSLPLSTFNSDYPGVHLQGTQFDSLRYFQRGEGLEFEARLRIDEMPSGAVPAFFTLGRHIYNNEEFIDEIDFEYLTKSINNAAAGVEPVLNTSWNDINLTNPQSPLPPEVYSSDEINVAGLELSDWNTFTMRWLPDRVEWLVNGELTKTETVAVPNDPMKVWLGIWVPAEAWPAAYSADLQPVGTVGENQTWSMEVDYVRVSTPSEPPSITFDDATVSSNFESILLGEYLHASAWGDVNGDGYPDLFAPKFNGFNYPDYGPNRLLINNQDGTFTESVQSELNVHDMAVSGAAFADFDNDGDADLIVGNFNPGEDQGPYYSRIYENDGAGNFTDRTSSSNFARSSLADLPIRTPFTFDYDGDGDLDVLLQHDVYNNPTGTYQSHLMRNDGNWVFTDQSAAAGLPVYVDSVSEGLQGLGGAVGDFDGDGDPDFYFPSPLFRAPDYSQPNSRMFLNDGDGTFTEYPYNAVYNNEPDWDPVLNDDWYVGAAAGDLNNDGLLDLVAGQHFVSAPSDTYGGGPHPSSVRVFLNQGNDGDGVPIFLDVTDSVGIEKIHTIQAHVEIQDMDNDGDFDIVTSATLSDAGQGGEQRPTVYRNTLAESGTLGFALNPGMDPTTNAGDWLHDLNRDPYYYPGAPTADFDGDGRLDIMGQEAISNFIADTGIRPSPLFRNTSGEGNHWLTVEVDARTMPGVNADGLGSQVKLYAAGHLGDPAYFLGMQELQVTNGYSSGTEPIAHFGLGSDSQAVDVIVVLPWGAGVLSAQGLAADQRHVLASDAPEMNVAFDGMDVLDGDTTPATTDGTHFGDVAVGQFEDHTFTIENNGSAGLSLGNIAIAGAHAADFAVVDGPASNVAPGGSTTFTVRFTPGAATERYAALTITNNDADENPYNFALRGVGALPEVRMLYMSRLVADNDTTPSEFEGTDFGRVSVGDTASRTFDIENQGNAPLTVSNVEVLGRDASDFAVTQQPTSPIAPGDTASFVVEFTPGAATPRFAALRFTNNDADESPYNFSIRGTGLPNVEMDVSGSGMAIADGDGTPNEADGTHFGMVPVGQSSQQVFTIDNLDTATLNLTGTPLVEVVGVHKDDFVVTVDPSSSVAGGGSTTFTLTFTPGATTVRYAALRIFNNDPDENPYNFAIRGKGVPDVDLDVSGNGMEIADGDVTPTTADDTHFGDVSVGSSTTNTFTIDNTGSMSLSLTGTPLVEIVGGDSAAFVVTQQPSASVSSGGSTTFDVEFAPTRGGLHYAAIKIRSNDPDEAPYNFAIRGNGVVAMMSATTTSTEMLAYMAWLDEAEPDTDASTDATDGMAGPPASDDGTTIAVNDAAFEWLEGQLASWERASLRQARSTPTNV